MENTPIFKLSGWHHSMVLGWARSIALTLVVAAVTLQCAQTPGAQPPSGPARNIAQLDRNNDARVSRTEFSSPPQRFKTLDGDEDGYLTAQELPRRQGAETPRPVRPAESP